MESDNRGTIGLLTYASKPWGRLHRDGWTTAWLWRVYIKMPDMSGSEWRHGLLLVLFWLGVFNYILELPESVKEHGWLAAGTIMDAFMLAVTTIAFVVCWATSPADSAEPPTA